MNRPLRYDFTIYKNDVWVGTIEFNGLQHYKPVPMFGGKEKLEIQKEHDFQKIVYAIEHNAPILIIPYKTCEGSVEYLVSRFLSNLNLITGFIDPYIDE